MIPFLILSYPCSVDVVGVLMRTALRDELATQGWHVLVLDDALGKGNLFCRTTMIRR